MSITNYAAFKSMLRYPNERLRFNKDFQNGSTALGPHFDSLWTRAGSPAGVGATPGAAAVPSRTIAGALAQRNGGANPLRLIGAKLAAELTPTNSVADGGILVIADRLSHQGGLDATLTTEQTTNLPTAALTRYTTGAGVMAALEVYTLIGVTNTTATIKYTNQAGTANQVSPAASIGASGLRAVGTFVVMPLASGDSGVRSVASVTLAASTGTVGNFGVTLFRPLLAIPLQLRYRTQICNPFEGLGGFLPEILDDTCLMMFVMARNNDVTGVLDVGSLHFSEDR